MIIEDLTASVRAQVAALALHILANKAAVSSGTALYRRKADYAPLPAVSLIRRHAQLWDAFAGAAARHEALPDAGTQAACSEALQSLLSALDEAPGLSPLRYPALLAEAAAKIAERR